MHSKTPKNIILQLVEDRKINASSTVRNFKGMAKGKLPSSLLDHMRPRRIWSLSSFLTSLPNPPWSRPYPNEYSFNSTSFPVTVFAQLPNFYSTNTHILWVSSLMKSSFIFHFQFSILYTENSQSSSIPPYLLGWTSLTISVTRNHHHLFTCLWAFH